MSMSRAANTGAHSFDDVALDELSGATAAPKQARTIPSYAKERKAKMVARNGYGRAARQKAGPGQAEFFAKNDPLPAARVSFVNERGGRK